MPNCIWLLCPGTGPLGQVMDLWFCPWGTVLKPQWRKQVASHICMQIQFRVLFYNTSQRRKIPAAFPPRFFFFFVSEEAFNVDRFSLINISRCVLCPNISHGMFNGKIPLQVNTSSVMENYISTNSHCCGVSSWSDRGKCDPSGTNLALHIWHINLCIGDH